VGARYYTHIVSVGAVQVEGLGEVDVGVGDDPRVMEVVGGVRMRDQTVGNEHVAGLRLDLGKLAALGLAVLIQVQVVEGGVNTLGVGVELLAQV
jgi:hypothetical protein